MQTANPRYLMTPDDHAELSLLQRRAEFLRIRSDTVAWRNPELREQIEDAYADVKTGIGVKAKRQ
jgi:hypothetical protein